MTVDEIIERVDEFVSVQSYQRKKWDGTFRARRYGYVLAVPGRVHYVSQYRWGSETAARTAGVDDLVASMEHERETQP